MQALFRNGAALTLSKVVEKGLTFAIIVLASRRLGTDGMMPFFSMFALIALFVPAINMGLRKLCLQRWHGLDDDARAILFTKLVALRLLLGVMLYPIVWGVATTFYGELAEPGFVAAAFLATYLEDFADLLRSPEMARGNPLPDVIIPVVAKVCLMLLLQAFVKPLDAGMLLWFYAGAQLISAIASLLASRHSLRNIRGTDGESMARLCRRGLPFTMTSVFVMIFTQIDTVMLTRWRPDEVSGYAIAYKVVLVFAVLSSGMCSALFPRVSELKAKGRLDIARFEFTTIMRLFAMTFMAMAIGMAVWGPAMLPRMFGSEFAASDHLMILMAPLLPLAAFTNLLGFTLESYGRQRAVMRVGLTMATFNIAANFVVIPIAGAAGAAITTVGTELIGLAAMGSLAHRLEILDPRVLFVVRVGAYLVFVGSVCWLCVRLPLDSALMASISACGVVGLWMWSRFPTSSAMLAGPDAEPA